MRRKDREVTDFNEMVEIVAACEECCIALNDTDGYPYVLPLNFGYKVDEGKLILYFHSALDGYKHQLMKADNRASFAMCCNTALKYSVERKYCTMNFESVVGKGEIIYVDDEQEKMQALTLLTDRLHPEGHFDFATNALPRTSVYKLLVKTMTAKRKS